MGQTCIPLTVASVSEAQGIVRGLGGDWKSNMGLAPCPICQTEGRRDQRGLSVKDASERTLVCCHKSGCAALDILAACKDRGLIQGAGPASHRSQIEIDREREARRNKQIQKQRYCDDIFSQAVPITGTLVQTYLESRGIVGLQGHKMKNTLRFHPALHHSRSGQDLPAMIARIRGPGGRAMGLHRTYLKTDGSGKADLQGGAKMMLGAASGGSVRFGPDQRVIALAEGIETALSIARASRLTVWATLSTSGMKGLILPPPPVAEVVVICADHDAAGLAAAEQVAGHLEAHGRAVSVITPPKEGQDFNDVLRGQA